ncbi:class I SAM-dependent methyltransferase [Arenimonas sp.]|uniref:class I SAM-dependent methyltransferase n=1 Tax=Arenimonas sp. TaxID=1872635 RepID=UPI0039E66445
MKLPFPPGHFYSPIVDTEALAQDRLRVWPGAPTIVGIDFDDASHLHVLQDVMPRLLPAYDYPETLPDSDTLSSFYTRNSQFSWLDARALFALLHEWRPRRVIEVGSGYSSLLMADVNRRFLGGACEISCIEPYPRPFLQAAVPGIARLLVRRVQDVPMEEFARLEAGDVLFIDSSHVAKTGSDVNHLYFEVLPRLTAGVRIHVHDIFLPNDYPQDWAIADNRSWNEQYLLRALLMHSTAFRVVFGCSYAFHRFPDEVRAALALPSGAAFGGGSFWIEKTA